MVMPTLWMHGFSDSNFQGGGGAGESKRTKLRRVANGVLAFLKRNVPPYALAFLSIDIDGHVLDDDRAKPAPDRPNRVEKDAASLSGHAFQTAFAERKERDTANVPVDAHLQAWDINPAGTSDVQLSGRCGT